MLNLAPDDRLAAREDAIWALAEKSNPIIGVNERKIERQGREHGGELFDASMASRHHDCAVFGHCPSCGSGGRRGTISLLGFDQTPTVLRRCGP